MSKYLVMGMMFALNLFDASATNFVLSKGYGSEVNPVMAFFYTMSPTHFFLAKCWGVIFYLAVLGTFWERKVVKVSGYVGLVIFSCVVGYQLVNLPIMLGL